MDDESFKVLDNTSYSPVGHCIYCGATERLEREHILPFGLSGTATLPESTCRECARITAFFEQAVLRGPFWPVRVFRDLKSRTKHQDAPKALPLTLVRNGQEQTIELQIDDYPILLHFPVFAPPAHLTQSSEYRSGILMSGIASVLFGPRPDDVAKSFGATELRLTNNYQPVAFARMLAKIAYSFAAAERKIDDLDGDPFVLPAILGKVDEIGRWVGTLTKPLETHTGQLHRIVIHHENEKGLLIAEVQLFADSQTPSYGVILGKLKPPRMTEQHPEAEEDRRNWNRKVVEAYQRALTPLTRIASSLVGLWALTYVLGWQRADSYYAAFGAAWLATELTLSDLPSFSYWPVLAFAIGVLFTFTDLADRYRGKGMRGIWVVTGVAVAVPLCAGLWLSWKANYNQSAVFYANSLPFVAALIGLHFGEIALKQSERTVKWTSGNIWNVCFLLFWFFSCVGLLGKAEGKRDSHPDQTRLNIVEKADGETHRLLLPRDGMVYAAILREGESPKITILGREDVRYIYKQAPPTIAPPPAKAE